MICLEFKRAEIDGLDDAARTMLLKMLDAQNERRISVGLSAVQTLRFTWTPEVMLTWASEEPDAALSLVERGIVPIFDLRRASLQGRNLDHAFLRWANLAFANLRNATLRGADLMGASLHKALLEGADLTGALRGRGDAAIPGWWFEELGTNDSGRLYRAGETPPWPSREQVREALRRKTP